MAGMALQTLRDAGRSLVGPIRVRPGCQVMIPTRMSLDEFVTLWLMVSEVTECDVTVEQVNQGVETCF